MEIKVLGNQLSQYGSTISFYKGLRISFPHKKDEPPQQTQNDGSKSGKTLVIGMGDCIPVRPFSSFIECLAEVRMIWKDKNEDCILLSLRLYLLPENSPKGRNDHGEDEVVAVKDHDSPKSRMVIRAEDFGTWLAEDVEWNWGLKAMHYDMPLSKVQSSSNGIISTSLLANTRIDFSEIEREKEKDGILHSNVTVLSFSRYCRYKAALRRFEHVEDPHTRVKLIQTLSGFATSFPNTRIMFAKEDIDYPDLETHEMLCPHLAPKLKGRPKGRKKITSRVSDCSSPAPSSEFSVDSCETNDSDVFDGKHLMKNKNLLTNSQRLTRNKSKVDAPIPESFTTLSGRVSKQRLALPSNKRKDEDSDDSEDDEEYSDRSANRKKQPYNHHHQNHHQQQRVKDENEFDPGYFFNATQRLFSMFQIPSNSSKSPEELSFLLRFGSFLAERAQSNPKLLSGIKDVDLYSIYTRVQKLGGFNAIADNRVWKNLFEDSSEPGKNVAQGMTKRKYERILLPFEIYERELRDSRSKESELTISPIPKNYKGRSNYQDSQSKRYDTSSPAIEIIPLKNGTNSGELTLEHMREYQRHDNNSSDGLPVHVIMRSSSNGSDQSSSNEVKAHSGGQKENIPMKRSLPADISFRTDPRASFNHQFKKQKLDILREGGLEVTPISKKAQSDIAFSRQPSTHKQVMQPSVSLTSLTPVRAPKVIQSLNMYQSTNQVFKNPKEDVLNAIKGIKTECLDLTSRKTSRYDTQFGGQKQPHSTNHISLEDVRKSYRGSNPDLQITLVKSQQQQQQPQQQESTSSSSPSPSASSSSNRYDNKSHASSKQTSKPSSTSSVNQLLSFLDASRSNFGDGGSGTNDSNSAFLAAANQLQKMQQQGGLPLFPFLSGIDITPMRQQQQQQHQQQQSTSLQNHPNLPLDSSSLMSYISLYSNPLLQGQNFFPNLSPAVDLLKFYNNSSAPKDRAPSKN